MVLTFFDISLALSIGIFTGLVLQRGRICTNTAFRNIFLIGNFELFLVILITVTVELIGYLLLSSSIIPGLDFVSNPIPFSIILLPLGGFIFGIGTVVAGGCAGGTCYRIGEGSLKSLLAFLGFTTGIGLLAIGPLSDLMIEIREQTLWKISDQAPSLEQFFPRWVWTILAIIIMFGILYFYKNSTKKLTHLLPRWTPIVSGLILGILGIFARISSTSTGREFGFSTTDGIGNIIESILLIDPSNIQWAAIFIIGLISGAFLSSIQIKEFKLKIPNKVDGIRFFGGGLLLGVGAMLAMGCNFGHLLGGIPELGISSIVAFLFMILGNSLGSYIFYIKLKQKIPDSTPGELNIIFR